MSETATAGTARGLPLFYNRVVPLRPAEHRTLRLSRDAGYAHAARAQTVPLGLGELPQAAQHYPIVFAGGDGPVPLALLGLEPGANLFVQPDGRWLADCYVPAYVRAFPFIFVEDDSRALHIAIEPEAAALNTTSGQRLFEDGKPTQTLNEAVGVCTAYRDNAMAAAVFARALDAAGLLQEEQATINFTQGGGAHIRGFKTAKAERLDAVDDATFLEWRRRGWLAMIYAHLHSAGRWGRLIQMAADRRPATGTL